MPIPESSPRWLTVEKAAEYLGCSPQTIRAILHRGEIRASRLGNGGSPYVIDRLDLDKFLERRKRIIAPYRRGSKPWVAKRHAEKRVA